MPNDRKLFTVVASQSFKWKRRGGERRGRERERGRGGEAKKRGKDKGEESKSPSY